MKSRTGENRRSSASHSRLPGISRRHFLKALGVSAAGVLAASCQPGAAPATPALTPTLAPTRGPGATTSARPMSAQVAIAKADNYDPKLVRQQVQTLLDGLGGLGDVVHSGDRVAIKVNLTGGTGAKPLRGVTPIESYATHPAVVQALGELVRDAGARQLLIVEGVPDPFTFSAWGYQDAAKALGADLIDLNRPEPYPDFAVTPVGPDWFIYESFTFNRILEEADVFISVSKMKCHWWCGVTHSMKNLVGLVPLASYQAKKEDGYRSALHGSDDETKTRLPRVVMDLNRARPIHLSLIDGIKTMEGGEGPWIDKVAPVEAGVLLAGKNPVATDAVATAVMGFDPTADRPDAPFLRADNHLNLAYQLGLGTNRLGDIKVVGVPVADVRHAFKPAEE